MASARQRASRAGLLGQPSAEIIERLGAVVCGQDGELFAGHLLADKFHAYVDCLPRSTRAVVLAELTALDQAARLYPRGRGRRFVDLDPWHANRYVSYLLRGRLPGVAAGTRALRQLVAFCYYDLREVRERLGYDPDPHIASVARARLKRYGDEIGRTEERVLGLDTSDATPPGERDTTGGAHKARQTTSVPHRPLGGRPTGLIEGRFASGDIELSCDAVIVGSGAGGATMAAELSDAGIDVVLIDEGGYHPTEEFGTDAVRALGTLYRAGGSQTIVGKPPIAFLEGRCVGGSTVVNGGMCWRTPPQVLRRWSHELGVAAVSPPEMERHFEKVEARLSIGPQDPESIGRDAELLEQGARARGWTVNRSNRNQLHCGGCDNCLCGCPTGAKRSMLVTNVPRALHRGARLIAGCRVERITRTRKRATGVVGSLLGPDGRPRGRLKVRARIVVAACGGLQTPALIARSGFRSPSGALGRNLALHPSAPLAAIFDEEVNGWQGVHQAFQVTEFLDDGILVTASTLPPAMIAANLQQIGRGLVEQMSHYGHMVVAGCLVEDTASGLVRTVPGVGPVGFYNLTDGDARRVVRGVSLAAEAMFSAGAARVLLPLLGAPKPMNADETRRFLSGPIRREALQLFTVHAMGTARMSDDRTRGVVSSYGEFHDAAGLFVADSSMLPGPVGVNPMETIIALVTRNAERLLQEPILQGA